MKAQRKLWRNIPWHKNKLGGGKKKRLMPFFFFLNASSSCGRIKPISLMNRCSCQQLFSEFEHAECDFSQHVPKLHHVLPFTGVSSNPPPPVGKVTTPAVKKVQDVSLMHPFHGHAQCLGGINVFACTVTAALWRLCSLCEKPEANGSKEYADIFGAELKFREKKDIAHFSGAVLTYACTWTLLTFVAFNRWHLWIHSVCLQVQNDGHCL